MVTTRSKVFSFPHSRFIGFDHVWDEIERLTAAGATRKVFLVTILSNILTRIMLWNLH
jgi:hypothetical protein